MSLHVSEADKARQEELYAFLLARGDRWTRMRDVPGMCSNYPLANPFRSFHNSRARRLLTRDIEAINLSGRYEKIIISGNRGIKLATQEEYRRFVLAEYKEVFSKLSRVRQIARKGSLDQQTDLEGEIREAFLGGV